MHWEFQYLKHNFLNTQFYQSLCSVVKIVKTQAFQMNPGVVLNKLQSFETDDTAFKSIRKLPGISSLLLQEIGRKI